MTTIIQGDQLREIALGRGVVSKATGTLAEAVTPSLFTIAGGEVLITALWAKVTTAITVANTVTIQANPTTGDTAAIAASVRSDCTSCTMRPKPSTPRPPCWPPPDR